ncbi:MAG: hypothetical protein AB8B87_27165 [Granulosicoccus sp.]
MSEEALALARSPFSGSQVACTQLIMLGGRRWARVKTVVVTPG